ncbi:putative c6 zinc finger domain-containing protein [Phaeomoniella chlamydospora]|uniref:Putative c6 zinc finger domain-containing protein n=1 Tax=Phaeomoniella chlamydospora TaxID=158046 RepID=A0A0G2EJJ5_PHACM|nr:putative c6 zinc finger domain-containing protein [Phaeomoniella chlamydospora]
MRLTASHYSSSANRRVLLQEANTSSIFQVPDSAFKVQALLLLAMDAYISLENSRGCEIQRQAIEIAKGIGMHRRDYSYLVGQHGPIVQESWRRTWWDCYTLAALTSAIHGTNLVELVSLEDIDVPLPGPCDDYKDCRPPQDLQTLDEMRDRMFTDDNFTFSSFAYKIEATTIMLSALRLSRESFAITDAQIDAIDASIANFLLSLPQDSRQVASRDGAVDELIFAAHMIIHWVTIIMHRPHSSLAILRSHYDTECTKIRTPADVPSSFNLHTSKALDAANALSNLATIRTPLENHTPCFACSIALSATVHLPAYLLESDPTRSQTLKGRLRLALSTLGTLSEIFPIAAIVKRQLGQFARDTFIHPAKTAATRDETNIALDAATTQLPTLTHQAFGAYDDAMPNDFTGADEGSLWLSNLIASGGLEQSDLGMTMDFEANE